jgi:ABC-2 type transport system ATP-binding protein
MSVSSSRLLEGRNLVKAYRGKRVVDGIDIHLAEGRCVGLLGPNGAGKSTTFGMLMGITEPTSGEVRYKGKPLGLEFRTEAGIMLQSTALPRTLTVRELLSLYASFYDKPCDIDLIAAQCGISAHMGANSRQLSGGERQRLLIAIAMINDPRILFLDEPTTGLDPRKRHEFWAVLRAIRDEHRTVLLSTHYMDEAVALCDEIVLMNRGRIVVSGAPDDLLRSNFNSAILRFPEKDCESSPGVSGAARGDDGMMELVTQDIDSSISKLVENGVSLRNLEIRRASLEELFLRLTLQPER